MNTIALLVIHLLLSCTNPQKMKETTNNHPIEDFKRYQLTFDRVKNAYDKNYLHIKENLADKGIDSNNFELYLRAFKEEKVLEIWAKTPNATFALIESFSICASSGKIGPKRKQGDGQVPEGFYRIDRFNPLSNYHLSLGINYPNVSDKILGNKKNLGGDIFIHGGCVTAGCLPMTDELISMIYIYAVEAKNNGQETIAITIYPKKMTSQNYKNLVLKNNNIPLYRVLKDAYDFFEKHRQLPAVFFRKDGSMYLDMQ